MRKRFSAAQNIFSTQAGILTKALPGEKIFDSPLENPLRRFKKVSIRKDEG